MKKKPQYNFGGLPAKFSGYKNSEIVVLPVPFDKTSSWIRGSAKGPGAVIEASRNMELYDIDTGTEVYTRGIHTAEEIVSGNSREMVRRVYRKAREFLEDDRFVVVLGGEHTVSLGSVKAHAERFSDFGILHLDAHSDRRDSYEGVKYCHASVMARAAEIVDNIVSVGIRSMDVSELGAIDPEKVFYAQNIQSLKNWTGRVLKALPRNVYITFDLDVLDPSIMPSTGTPEPGGLGWYEVLELMEKVAKNRNIVGFDLVELCPSGNAAPDFLAAKLIYKLLSLRFNR